MLIKCKKTGKGMYHDFNWINSGQFLFFEPLSFSKFSQTFLKWENSAGDTAKSGQVYLTLSPRFQPQHYTRVKLFLMVRAYDTLCN